jgi:hypothetical protein
MLLKAVKAFHTLAWFTIEACMLYVIYAGIRGQSDRRAGLAATVVALETLVFAANGFHCPLTAVARNLGDSTGSVTDIYLPRWLARNLPAIHVPLIIIAGVLHWRNLLTTRRHYEESVRAPQRDRFTAECSAPPHRPRCPPAQRARQQKHVKRIGVMHAEQTGVPCHCRRRRFPSIN